MSTVAKKIAFHTLGCKLNFSETSSLSRDSLKYGYENVNSKEFADIYVFNTCSVTENANKETRKLIRRSKRINPNAFIALIGCYAQLKPKELIDIKDVNLVLGTADKFDLLNHLDKIDISDDIKSSIGGNINDIKIFNPSFSNDDRTRSFLKVQDGCDYSCTFCTIPLARGRSRSSSINKTINIAKDISSTNTKEIVITGINIGDFGKGTNESFYDLIKEMDSQIDIERFRISSIEPNLLNDKIIEFCFQSKKFMPHFHIPLQSGSDKILKAMRRRYDKKVYQNRIKKIKDINQDTCIGVDVIVGFPGESDEDFLETYNFLIDLDITYLHVFSYSERADTNAIKLDEKVSKSDKSKRSKMLHILSEKKKHSFYNNFINKKRPILFEGLRNGFLVGHTDNYIKTLVEIPVSFNNKIVDINLMENKGNHMVGYI